MYWLGYLLLFGAAVSKVKLGIAALATLKESQAELYKVLKKHYPNMLTGDAHDSGSAIGDLAMITGLLLASIELSHGSSNLRGAARIYLGLVSKNATGILGHTNEFLAKAAQLH